MLYSNICVSSLQSNSYYNKGDVLEYSGNFRTTGWYWLSSAGVPQINYLIPLSKEWASDVSTITVSGVYTFYQGGKTIFTSGTVEGSVGSGYKFNGICICPSINFSEFSNVGTSYETTSINIASLKISFS